MKKSGLAVLLILGVLPSVSFATGILLPKDDKLPALAIKHQRVDITIKDGVADARMEQVFKNNVNRDLEAVYIFPLPASASIADFAMYINGKRVSGELVPKDKARKIYQDIVRRMRDPGLLEHMGGQLFRVSVYPVPKLGEQRIELAYTQTLEYESDMFKFVYPLRTAEKASRTLEDFTVGIRLASTTPIKTIYSPSHDAGITRKGEHEAVIGFEEEQSLLDRDFVLYYGVSEKEFGLNLLTHAPKGEDGFFMMMIAPAADPELARVIPKDIAFVFDTSGSMAGEKIAQARNALTYCIKKLNADDRFDIIRFSTDVDALNSGLVKADKDARDRALRFIDGLQARGGTDIDGALRAALEVKRDEDRPYIIAFLTDGLPTIGTTDSESIVKNVTGTLAGNTRIFVFGVGEKVNTHLLDQISGEAGGVSHYVKPEDDIEVTVSSFYDKVSHPVLSAPELAIDKIKVTDLYPKKLPDLFCGGQVTVFGRYAGQGHVAVTLCGAVNGKKKEVVHEATFPEQLADNAFIPRLWATRKVGYLLDEIRLHGEGKELKDEVVRLSKEYGIMTPYTSYLVLESDEEYASRDIRRNERRQSGRAFFGGERMKEAAERRIAPGSATEGAAFRPAAKREAGVEWGAVPMFEDADTAVVAARVPAGPAGTPPPRVHKPTSAERQSYMERETGAGAIALSKAIEEYKREEKDLSAANVRRVGKRIFYRIREAWVDRRYRESMATTTLVYGSDEYFAYIEKHPELKQCFALGPKVIICLDDKTAVIVE